MSHHTLYTWPLEDQISANGVLKLAFEYHIVQLEVGRVRVHSLRTTATKILLSAKHQCYVPILRPQFLFP